MRLPPQVLAAGGLDIAAQPAEQVAAFSAMLADAFVPVNLAAFAAAPAATHAAAGAPPAWSPLAGASLRVLNVDPPVLCVDGFLPDEVCDALRQAAEASGRMERSRVGGADTMSGTARRPAAGGASGGGGGGGGGGAGGAQGGEAGAGAAAVGADIRTSTTLAIGREALAASPQLDAALSALLERAEALFGGPPGEEQRAAAAGGGPEAAAAAAARAAPGGPPPSPGQLRPLRLRRALFTKPPASGELVAELPQVARYLPGERFLAHEDAFPPQAALRRGFQRRATLLVYLNDCDAGGRTRFEHLGPLDVAPKKGRAAVFFPAFRGGRPDGRTLHAATEAAAGCEKWVFQLWLTSAVAGGAGAGGGAGAAGTSAGVTPAAPPRPSPLLPPRGGAKKKTGGGKRR